MGQRSKLQTCFLSQFSGRAVSVLPEKQKREAEEGQEASVLETLLPKLTVQTCVSVFFSLFSVPP